MRFALIEQGVVVNVVLADATPGENYVESSVAGPGWVFDEATGTLSAPEPAPLDVAPVEETRHISVGAFFDRFGAQKYSILASADPTVQALIKDCTVRKFIDLDRADLPMGLQMIVSAGFTIDPEAVISAPITENERS